MKTLQRFKFVSLLLILMLALSAVSFAQTPQFYNFNNGATNNSFPLNQGAGKMVQLLVPAGNFTQPTPATAGNISKLYFLIAATYPLSSTYTDFKIMLKQIPDSLLTAGSFLTGGWDTVYKRASVTLTAAGGTWLMITLDHPFNFNPAQSLAIQMEQCASTQTTGFSLTFTGSPGNRRFYSVGGCPFVYQGVSTAIINCGFDVAPSIGLPEVLYYKFRLNPSATTVTNFATSPPAGTNTATVTGLGLTSGGQFDSCMVGTSMTGTGSTHFLNTNWTTNIGTSSFTIGFWLGNISNQTGSSACYLFGDPTASSFRCFWAGAGIGAADTALLFRYTGMPDMRLPLTSLSSVYVHFVYDSAASTLKSYKNGVFVSQVTWTGINLTGSGPFKVGGYSTSANSMLQGMKMDEFRFYKRALDQAEITATWNNNLGVVTGVTPISTNIPGEYKLSQNYPNPFNPVTKINFALPKSGLVTLKIYDVLGREVAKLVNETKQAGNYSVDFNASNLTSGVYFYRIEVNGFVDTKKMTLIK